MNNKNIIYNIGTKIFVIDFSGFIVKGDDDIFRRKTKSIERVVREKMRNGNPFVVISNPYHDFVQHETYIDVKFEDSDDVYSIPNTDSLRYTDRMSYFTVIEDIEECRAFGY